MEKNYKEIAKIIKVHNDDKDIQRSIAIDLADYFEKEDILDNSIPNEEERGLSLIPSKAPNFNRKQFLKDCEVEK